MQVILYGLLADKHLFRHLAILVALSHEADDLALALAEMRSFPAFAGHSRHHFRWRSELTHDSRSRMGIQPDFARMPLADALDDQFGRRLLQDDPRTTEFHGLYELVLVL